MNLYKNVYRVNSENKYMLSVSTIDKDYQSFLFELIHMDQKDKSLGTSEFFLSVDDARIICNHILNYKLQLLPFSRIKGSVKSDTARAMSIGSKNNDYSNCYVQIKNGTGEVKNGIRVLSKVETNYFYNCSYDELIVIFHKINSYIYILDSRSF